jgi:plasmid maintenance system antidote protein VapI
LPARECIDDLRENLDAGLIIKRERAVTIDTALRLARFYGTSPEFWMNLQAMFLIGRSLQQVGSQGCKPHRYGSCRIRIMNGQI